MNTTQRQSSADASQVSPERPSEKSLSEQARRHMPDGQRSECRAWVRATRKLEASGRVIGGDDLLAFATVKKLIDEANAKSISDFNDLDAMCRRTTKAL